MAIDFPTPTQVGETFSPAGLNTVYIWDGTAWNATVPNTTQFLPLTGGNLTGDLTFSGSSIIFNDDAGTGAFTGDVTAANITAVSNALTAIKAAASDSSTDLAGLKAAIASALSSF